MFYTATHSQVYASKFYIIEAAPVSALSKILN